jgi:hypothetical protein
MYMADVQTFTQAMADYSDKNWAQVGEGMGQLAKSLCVSSTQEEKERV